MAQPYNKALQPLTERLFALLRESRWLLLVAAAFYFILILYGYDRADSAWSHSASSAVMHNPGGLLGAWLADLMLYIFGFSAWWWVGLLSQRVWASYRSIRADSLFGERALWMVLLGFFILLFSSSALEALRLYTWQVALPLAPGGMLGAVLGSMLAHWLGYTGATLLLLVLMAASFSLFTGMSWLRFIDSLGGLLETSYLWARNAWQTRQDKRIGEQAVTERSAIVEVEKKRVEEHQPIRIEMPVVEVQRSTRVEQEKQVSLFSNMPDSALPPLHLLDQPTQQVEVISSDTLEFTSRLIERKLNDFGVEVKVVAAYPGPVITRYEIDPAVGVKGSQITNLVRDLARALSVVS
ncbi:MAG: DNA translocase FtsK 4TM domain-containing protein, partial [Gallionellaceae bacterium]